MKSDLIFVSDDRVLEKGFAWAKEQALGYTFCGDAVGDWYEAALPGRAAFCMRDVAHQANGAHLLGLSRFNRNMLQRFAENISAGRDWCSFWEIDKHNRPCPADYRDDGYFWYNLPANFDVLDCCLRQYLWTGDRIYLENPALRFFYAKSVHEYVHHWDRDGDGLLDHTPEDGFRGIATYNEEVEHPLVGGDLAAAQYAGYRAYAAILELEERFLEANELRRRAAALRRLYNTDWWNAQAGRFHGFMRQDRSFSSDDQGLGNLFALYYDLADGEERVQRTLAAVMAIEGELNVESRSYVPETLYRYGRNQEAYAILHALFDPGLPRREYPELSFALIGALATGLMGVTADARERLVSTFPRLGATTGEAEMGNIPIFETLVDVRHRGCNETTLTNRGQRAVYWRAGFPGQDETLRVDGQRWTAQQTIRPGGQMETYVLLRVGGGERQMVSR